MDGFSEWFEKKAQLILGARFYASVVRAVYVSLLDEGFDEEQAMRIIDITMRHLTKATPDAMRVFNEMNRGD